MGEIGIAINKTDAKDATPIWELTKRITILEPIIHSASLMIVWS